MSRSGIVNVRMVITEEKILSNIDKVQKMINPNSKKQIVQLEEDTYFKDMIESIKTYLFEYPKKKNFPSSVYKAAYSLVEYATNQFEENTKRIEELIRQREQNISVAGNLKQLMNIAANKYPDWQQQVQRMQNSLPEDIIDTLKVVGEQDPNSEDYQSAIKILNARINNLESNLHIEIDMERIEDRSKALSYIGIEIADALKTIPTPVEEPEVEKIEQQEVQQQVAVEQQQEQEYLQQTTFDIKPTLWQRIKNSKIARAITYIMRIRVVLDVPALPEGRGENNF